MAERLVSGPGEIGGVGAAGEGDDEGREFGEIGEELGLLLLQRDSGRIVDADLDYAAHGKSIAQWRAS